MRSHSLVSLSLFIGLAVATAPETLSFAVCLFDNVQLLDYAGPMDLFGYLDNSDRNNPKHWTFFDPVPAVAFDFTYIAPNTSVWPTAGPEVIATTTYEAVLAQQKQFDVILVPGGIGVNPGVTPESLLRFIQAQFGGARYVLSVCTGAWAMAQSGTIDGRRATTNKAAFKQIVNDTVGRNIDWVPKARWVVDDNYWSASGVSSGIDMAVAWLKHMIGDKLTLDIQAIVEVSNKEEGDDEWAVYHGLVPAA